MTLNEENYNIPLSNIYEKLELFISNLENVININFTSENCYNNSLNDNDLNLFDLYNINSNAKKNKCKTKY